MRAHGGRGKREKRQPGGLSAKRKRLEFVSAKRAQAPIQGACATIERTVSNPAGCAEDPSGATKR